jgi:hypothetical protein
MFYLKVSALKPALIGPVLHRQEIYLQNISRQPKSIKHYFQFLDVASKGILTAAVPLVRYVHYCF